MNKPNYEVFEFLLDRFDVKASVVCKATGVDPSTISSWKNGRYVPKNDKLERLAEFFHVAPWDFWKSLDEIEEEYSHTFEVAAGQGRINEEYEQTGEFSTVRICGDSMYPSLYDGDIVKVHHVTDDISPKDFAIVKINGDESTCKHIEITGEGIWLRAENKAVFEDKFYTVQDVMTLPVTLIGVATEIISRKL